MYSKNDKEGAKKRMVQKIYQKFYRYLLITLLGLLGICVWQSFFYVGGESSLEQYNPLILLLGTLVLIFAGIAVARVLSSCSQKILVRISIVLLGIALLKLFIFGFCLTYIPPYDLIHIHSEAVNMLEAEKIVNVAYYAKYPTQQPLTILLFFVFSGARFLGITDYNTVGIVFNILAIFLSFWFIYKICCFWSLKYGVISLILCIMDPMIFSWASYYYTDTICMPFMLGGVYLFLRAEKTKSSKIKFLLFMLSALVIFLGGKIRVTSAFVLIAIVMYLFIKSSLRVFLKKISAIMVGIICAIIFCNMLLSAYGVENKRYEYPITHWLKMGLNETSSGAYSSEDERTTMAQSTYEGKVQENIKTIKRRLKEMGVSGVEKLYLKKMTRVWSTAAFTESLQERVEDYNILYKYTIGRSSTTFKYWKQMVRCAILILAFIGVIFEIKRKGFQNSWMFITIFGGILFYAFWEQKPRYSLCFLPILYIIETYSLTNVANMKEMIYVKIKRRAAEDFCFDIEKKKQLIKGIGVFVIFCTIITGGLSYSKYIISRDVQKDLRVNQKTMYRDGEIEEIDAEKGVTQSFTSKGDFNTIEVNFLNPNHISGQTYILKILDEKKNTLYSCEFSSNDIKNYQFHEFNIDTIEAKGDKFYLNISPYQRYEKTIGVNTAVYSLYTKYKQPPDYYPDGCLYVGEKRYKKNDLALIVSNQHKDALFSPYGFWMILGIALIAEFFITIYFYTRSVGLSKIRIDL